MIEARPRGGMTSVDSVPAPQKLDSGRISTREEAEIRVRQIRNGFWADFRPGDRRVANAHARMAIADEAFSLLAREDLSQADISRSTFLLIDARERLIQPSFSYGHFGRASDLWADGVSDLIKLYRVSKGLANV